MKTILLLLLSTASLLAQGRFSLAPTYWFNYNPYGYQTTNNYLGSNLQNQVRGYGVASSVGLALRYHFTPKWDLSAGILYYRYADHLPAVPVPYGDPTPFISEGAQLPLLLNYRVTTRRLSPYLSVGFLFTRSKTFYARPLTTDGVVGAGLIYRFQSGLSILMQPTASYSFYQPANGPGYLFDDYHSYNLGLQVQLLWHL